MGRVVPREEEVLLVWARPAGTRPTRRRVDGAAAGAVRCRGGHGGEGMARAEDGRGDESAARKGAAAA